MESSTWQVLVVEDEFDDSQVISKILRHHGVEVRVAGDGHECLEVLKTYRPTMVIMDLALPGMDGWETLKAMRQNPATADIPVIAVTAYHSSSVQEDTEKAGFNGYMPKPANPSHLLDHLRGILNA
ncbi:MAG: response regulator [Anaerolineae bacterium]|nr:response regulator [Anaerolineae bacterium]